MLFPRNIKPIVPPIALLAALASSPSASAPTPPDIKPSASSLSKPPRTANAAISASGQYLVSSSVAGSSTALSVSQPSRPEIAPRTLNLGQRSPLVSFFGHGTDDFYVSVRDTSGKIALLQFEPGKNESREVESDIKVAYVHVSASNGYQFPLISPIDKNVPDAYKVWSPETNSFVPVQGQPGIIPVAVPRGHDAGGYIGLRSRPGLTEWIYAREGRAPVVLGVESASIRPGRTALVSVYQADDKQWKAALLDGSDTDTIPVSFKRRPHQSYDTGLGI